MAQRNTGRNIARIVSGTLISIIVAILMQACVQWIHSLHLIKVSQPYRTIFYITVYSSWSVVYAIVSGLTWLLYIILNRCSAVSCHEGSCTTSSTGILKIVYGAIAVFCFLRFIGCYLWYGPSLLFQMFVGLMPSSSPQTIYYILSLPHLIILGTLSLWMVRAFQNYRALSIFIFFEIGAVSIAVAIRITEYLLREVPVVIPQLIALLGIGVLFHIWSRRHESNNSLQKSV
ncbi:MAG: hypothetical protein NT106_09300 [Candidatus Sumerlaeota bacterium]|nr:hypothetical protein [Candidatus Sumerlaeota bacterium]